MDRLEVTGNVVILNVMKTYITHTEEVEVQYNIELKVAQQSLASKYCQYWPTAVKGFVFY